MSMREPCRHGQWDALALVVTICRRFHLFARQLRDRHHARGTLRVADEYDVQDLMHALLNLHFDDVRAEEVTPSLAGKSARMDFLLKPEGLVLETKMTRRNLGQKEVADELIVDMKRYRSHPGLRTLVCFVYDPGGFCRSPAALENDLTGGDGRFRSVVIVCPRGM
jgi:REase_DpnII-MboI